MESLRRRRSVLAGATWLALALLAQSCSSSGSAEETSSGNDAAAPVGPGGNADDEQSNEDPSLGDDEDAQRTDDESRVPAGGAPGDVAVASNGGGSPEGPRSDSVGGGSDAFGGGSSGGSESTGADAGNGAPVGGAGQPPVEGDGGAADAGTSGDGPSDRPMQSCSDPSRTAGTELWRHALSAKPSDVAVDVYGEIFVAGTVSQGPLQGDDGEDQDAWLSKLDVSGEELWTRVWGSDSSEACDSVQFTPCYFDLAIAVAVDDAGSAHVLGEFNDGHENYRAWIKKLDPNGVELWTLFVSEPSVSLGRDLVLDSGGNLVVLLNGNPDATLWKVSPEGEEIWRKALPDGDAYDHLAVDASDEIWLTGRVARDADNAAGNWVRKYDSSGALLWERRQQTTELAIQLSIDIDAAGNATLGGELWSAGVDGDGNTLFAQEEAGTVRDLASDPRGGFALTGSTEGDGFWLQLYQAPGAPTWGISTEEARAGARLVAIDRCGNVISATTDIVKYAP